MDTWTELSQAEYDDVWTRFERVFAFRPDTRPEGGPGILEPTPSRTYRFEYPVHPLDESDLRESALRAFERCVPRSQRMYALDWNHACYWFDPHAASAQDWFHPVFPNGDYYIFLARDFSWGLFGHPWEQTICIFGEPSRRSQRVRRECSATSCAAREAPAVCAGRDHAWRAATALRRAEIDAERR